MHPTLLPPDGPGPKRSIRDTSGTRNEAHHLVDALDDQQLEVAVEVLRQLANEPNEQLTNEFAWIGTWSAEPDLGERSGETL